MIRTGLFRNVPFARFVNIMVAMAMPHKCASILFQQFYNQAIKTFHHVSRCHNFSGFIGGHGLPIDKNAAFGIFYPSSIQHIRHKLNEFLFQRLFAGCFGRHGLIVRYSHPNCGIFVIKGPEMDVYVFIHGFKLRLMSILTGVCNQVDRSAA